MTLKAVATESDRGCKVIHVEVNRDRMLAMLSQISAKWALALCAQYPNANIIVTTKEEETDGSSPGLDSENGCEGS